VLGIYLPTSVRFEHALSRLALASFARSAESRGSGRSLHCNSVFFESYAAGLPCRPGMSAFRVACSRANKHGACIVAFRLLLTGGMTFMEHPAQTRSVHNFAFGQVLVETAVAGWRLRSASVPALQRPKNSAQISTASWSSDETAVLSPATPTRIFSNGDHRRTVGEILGCQLTCSDVHARRN
jgi:hypothetical protein